MANVFKAGQHCCVNGPAPIICLVDDDASVLKSLGRLLTYEGYALLLFRDATEFISHAAHHPVPLVVVDYMMPGLSGLQVQECLHSLSPDTRLIMISADGDPQVRTRAMAGGACAFFHKPFDDTDFLASVGAAITGTSYLPQPISPILSPAGT